MGGRVEVRANFSDANKSVDANGVRDGKDDNIYEDKSRVRFN